MIAVGSFFAGVLFMFALGSPHTSIVVHPSSASAEGPLPSPPSGPGVILRGLTPAVPELNSIVLRGVTFSGSRQQLDGLHCENCFFNGVTLVYGGGKYQLPGATIQGRTRYELIGAASNTYQLLLRTGTCKVQEPPPQAPWLTNPNPKIPISIPTEVKDKPIDLIGLGKEK